MCSGQDSRRHSPSVEDYEEIKLLMHDIGCSEDRKLKISAANKGRRHTEDAKQKMSKKHKNVAGKNNPMFGKHHSEETKLKISTKAKLHIGNKNAFYGKHHSVETKQLISKAHKGKMLTQEQKDQLSMRIMCVETKIIYSSQVEASIATGFGRPAIRKSIKTGCAIGHNRFCKEDQKVHFVEIDK